VHSSSFSGSLCESSHLNNGTDQGPRTETARCNQKDSNGGLLRFHQTGMGILRPPGPTPPGVPGIGDGILQGPTSPEWIGPDGEA